MIPRPPASLPAAVWQLWLHPRHVTAIERAGGGFSGAAVYRCSAAATGQAWALRCWPAETTVERVAEVHRVVAYARRQGCDLLPAQCQATDGRTVTIVDSHCWELGEWRAGRPYAGPGGTAAEAATTAAAAAVAQFHRAVAGLASRDGAAPAIASRLRRIEQLDRWLLQPAVPIGPGGPDWLPTAAAGAARAWRTLLPDLRTQLAAAAPQRRPLQYALRDVHREHVLFQGPSVSALIDFDALRIDTPATDLARLVSSFACDLDPPVPFDQLWPAAVRGYRQHRPLDEPTTALARLLAQVTPLISLANWVVWVGVQRQAFDASAERIAGRVEHLLRSVRITCGC